MYVNRFEQRSLAWALVDVAALFLTRDDRSWLCVKIGAGDLENAVFTLVGICTRNDATLPDGVAETLRAWLGGYAGTEVAAAFEPYLRRVDEAGAVAEVYSRSRDGCAVCDRFENRPRRTGVGSMQSDRPPTGGAEAAGSVGGRTS